ncbi:MAG: 4'-phosphopantetheinyl transferase family protein [Rhodanobacteraceae bacterium]
MTKDLVFVNAVPKAAAIRLDTESIHLWQIPYTLSQGRAPLLALLGTYLCKPLSEVTLAQDTRGKPRLSGVDSGLVGEQRLEFNWSHSGDYALVALSRGLALGVDIERLDKSLRAIEIARRFFDSAEAETLASLGVPVRNHAFIGLWCAKEAILKASGEGLSFGLARLVFEWHTDRDWDLARIDPALGRKDDWRLMGFNAAPGYRGALAWRGPLRRIAAFRLAQTNAS